jgi:hypothetical protein
MKKLPVTEVYLHSTSHPEWQRHEDDYVFQENVKRARRAFKKNKNTLINTSLRSQLKEISRYAKLIDAGIRNPGDRGQAQELLPTISKRAENQVFEVIEKFGLEIFTPMFMSSRASVKKSNFSPQDRLRDILIAAIDIWQTRIMEGTDQESRAAKKTLQKLFNLLTPARFKRRDAETTRPISQDEIREFYYRQLFKLRQVQRALELSPGRNRSMKVKSVSQKFEISVDDLRDFLGVDEDGVYCRKALTLKEMARRLTAKEFKIRLSTVSNLI